MVVRVAADQHAERDEAVMPARVGQQLQGDGQLVRTGHPHDLDARRRDAVQRQRGLEFLQQPVDQRRH
jgi:hypothetical protein